jgi:hypothetical protein
VRRARRALAVERDPGIDGWTVGNNTGLPAREPLAGMFASGVGTLDDRGTIPSR